MKQVLAHPPPTPHPHRWAAPQTLRGKSVPLILNKVYQTFFTSNSSSSVHGHSRRGLVGVSGPGPAQENHTISLLREPVTVANIIAMPKILSSGGDVVYESATPEIHVNGSGLLGARAIKVSQWGAVLPSLYLSLLSPLPCWLLVLN